jgi:hypothetical protein
MSALIFPDSQTRAFFLGLAKEKKGGKSFSFLVVINVIYGWQQGGQNYSVFIRTADFFLRVLL